MITHHRYDENRKFNIYCQLDEVDSLCVLVCAWHVYLYTHVSSMCTCVTVSVPMCTDVYICAWKVANACVCLWVSACACL